MPLKGLDRFRQKLPALSGKKIAILPIFVVLMGAVALLTYLTFDSLPAASDSSVAITALYPLFGVLLVISVGFVLVWQMWFWRDRLKSKYGQTSYQRGVLSWVRRGCLGVDGCNQPVYPVLLVCSNLLGEFASKASGDAP